MMDICSRGTQADFNLLKNRGIKVEGRIAMANYGGIYRGTKVKNAQVRPTLGFSGC